MFREIDDALVTRILGVKPGVKRLSLSRNAIERLPSVVVLERLSTLTVLDLSHNRLITLGDELSGLSSLTHLNVAFNRMCVRAR